MNLLKIILFAAFTFSYLFSAKIDSKIIDANKTYYSKLLNSLSESNKTKPLEKILLEQIIKFNPPPFKEQNILPAKGSKDLKKLFDFYINDVKKINFFKQKLQLKKEKINTIEKEIAKLDNNSSKVLSFQLQDAFYHKQQTYYQKLLDKLHSQLKKIKKTIAGSVQICYIDKEKISGTITENLKKAEKLKESIIKLNISLEQLELVNKNKLLKSLQKKLNKKNQELHNLYYDNFQNKFLLFCYYLQNRDTETFTIEKELYKDAITYKIITKNEINNYFSPFLLFLEKKYIGQIETLAGSSKQELKEVIYKGWEFINKPVFNINGTPISIFKMALALIVFILGVIAGLLYKGKIKNIKTKRSAFTSSTKTLLANLGYYLIIIISFLISLNILGVKLSSLAIVAGALSVGIGFGLQNIVSNFVSGIILMFERSIKIGDYVEIGDNRGYITDIRMRSATIKTNENIDIVIPNQQFIESNVINWTMNDKIRRFSIPFGVAYGSDIDKVAKIVKEAVLNSDYRPYIIDKYPRKTEVIMTEMADSSVNFELLIWLAGSDLIDKPKRTKSYFLTIIYNTLNKNSIEIPYPQQDLHIRSVSNEIVKNFKDL